MWEFDWLLCISSRDPAINDSLFCPQSSSAEDSCFSMMEEEEANAATKGPTDQLTGETLVTGYYISYPKIKDTIPRWLHESHPQEQCWGRPVHLCILGEAIVLSDLLLRDQIGLHGWELELRLVLLPLPSCLLVKGCDMFSCVFWEDHSSGGIEDGVEEAIWGQGDQIGSRPHCAWAGEMTWGWTLERCLEVTMYMILVPGRESTAWLHDPPRTCSSATLCPLLMDKLRIPREEAVASRFWDVDNQERVYI